MARWRGRNGPFGRVPEPHRNQLTTLDLGTSIHAPPTPDGNPYLIPGRLLQHDRVPLDPGDDAGADLVANHHDLPVDHRHAAVGRDED